MMLLLSVLHNIVLLGLGGAIVADVTRGAHPLLVALAFVGAVVLIAVLAALRDTYRDEYR